MVDYLGFVNSKDKIEMPIDFSRALKMPSTVHLRARGTLDISKSRNISSNKLHTIDTDDGGENQMRRSSHEMPLDKGPEMAGAGGEIEHGEPVSKLAGM